MKSLHYAVHMNVFVVPQVSNQAGDKLVESIMLDYIMQLVARQGKVWTQSDHASKYMDGTSPVLSNLHTNITLETASDALTKVGKHAMLNIACVHS